ncbi:tyrosine-type recombinase/integrase [Agathobaculum butyriciproducens]|uniref:tyrosine-type recombinase/integrase n=1 Tax=Agathobaculum butyriciproducens TaxID=1628085 RepID=UPI003AEFD16F
MGAKRKDKKRRNLKRGESQRNDGRYSYRYKLPDEERYHYIYAKTLEELRKREELIDADLRDGINCVDGRMTVSSLLERYMSIASEHFTVNSLKAYGTAIKRIERSSFSQKCISDVKVSDAKKFFVDQYHEKLKFNTINVMKCVLSPAFQMAEEDDIIRKNPFRFRLSTVIPCDATERKALSQSQQAYLLEMDIAYTQNLPVRDGCSAQANWYQNEIIVLLGTGLRVSELYGLTLKDIDFKERFIHVNKQLIRTPDHIYKVIPPKSRTGNRKVPMSDAVYQALKDAVMNRESVTVEQMIDGYSGFVFLAPDGMPRVAAHLQVHMKCLYRYIRKYHDSTFPPISPHVLRHTFCTDMQQKLDIKVLQYVMGHSSIDITLNTYTHMSYDSVKKAFNKAMGIG